MKMHYYYYWVEKHLAYAFYLHFTSRLTKRRSARSAEVLERESDTQRHEDGRKSIENKKKIVYT